MGGPEIDEDPLALAHVLAQLVQVAVRIGLLEVEELLADDGLLLLLDFLLAGDGFVNLALEVEHIRMLGEHRIRFQQLIELVRSGEGADIADEGDRNQVVLILLDNAEVAVAKLFDPSVILLLLRIYFLFGKLHQLGHEGVVFLHHGIGLRIAFSELVVEVGTLEGIVIIVHLGSPGWACRH